MTGAVVAKLRHEVAMLSEVLPEEACGAAVTTSEISGMIMAIASRPQESQTIDGEMQSFVMHWHED